MSKESLTPSSSMMTLPSTGVSGPAASDDERQQWDLEKQQLYQQLDDKVCLLNDFDSCEVCYSAKQRAK